MQLDISWLFFSFCQMNGCILKKFWVALILFFYFPLKIKSTVSFVPGVDEVNQKSLGELGSKKAGKTKMFDFTFVNFMLWVYNQR